MIRQCGTDVEMLRMGRSLVAASQAPYTGYQRAVAKAGQLQPSDRVVLSCFGIGETRRPSARRSHLIVAACRQPLTS